jgi:serine/threonine protein kinase/Tfp pilus assembly protein PilF
MVVDEWIRVRQILEEALEQDPVRRPQFIAEACGGDAALQRDVEEYLRYQDAAEHNPLFQRWTSEEPEPAAEERDPERIGIYRILQRLGEGGMGVVYLAERDDGEYRQRVALKAMKPGPPSAQLLRLFRRERQILAQLQHPNIACLMDGGTVNGQVFYVMEYVEGTPVTAYCEERQLTLQQRLELFCRICEAVGYAHRNQIVHRDLKPGNILVNNDGIPKLLDFGLAKMFEQSPAIQRTTVSIGPMLTPAYASPEQVRGVPLSIATDVYSLGVLLYELLTGQNPQARPEQSPLEVCRTILEEDPRPPSHAMEPERQRAPAGPWGSDLDNIVLMALRKEPERRYGSAEELRADLGRYLGGFPVHASRGTSYYRLRKYVGRQRWRLAASSLGVVAVLATIASLSLAMRYSLRQRPVPTPTHIMVAVLPFENLTGDPEQDYISDGITDEMIVELSQLSPHQLGVIARTSAMRYKHSHEPLDRIGSELGADYLVEGTVKRFGPALRMTAELVRSKDRTQLWAGSYDGEVSGPSLLSFQESVAGQVALALPVVLPDSRMARETTARPLAYEAYLRGAYESNKRTEDSLQQAVGYFQRAISQDSRYAQAYAGLADCYNLLLEYYERRAGEDMADRAKTAAMTALKLQPDSSQSHASLAANLWHYEWKFAAAEAEFRQALELNPNNATAHHWYGLFLASRGRFEEAKKQMHLARILDPLSLIIITNVGWVDYYARDYDGAIASYREALQLDPAFQTAEMKLAWAYERKSMWGEALAARQRFYLAAGQLAIAQALAGNYARAGYPGVMRAILEETQKPDARQYYPDYEIAKLYATAGDGEKALGSLERAYAHRSGWLVYLPVEPAFDSLHTDPRFIRLIGDVAGQ